MLLVYLSLQNSQKRIQMAEILYFTPSKLCVQVRSDKPKRSLLQVLATKKNFKSNLSKGDLSPQSRKKIETAVNWLTHLSKPKVITNDKTGTTQIYKCGLITLSLPTGTESCTPEFFRDELLSSMLSAMSYKYQLSNYVWKIESQDRGSLHVHITVDKYIPYGWLLDIWCKLLKKNGLLEAYRSKFAAMSEREYINYRVNTDHPKHKTRFGSHNLYISSLVKAYVKGNDQKWLKPNCVDANSVKKAKNLGAYIAKYFSKNPNLPDDFKGRYWACSYQLSRLRSIKFELTGIHDQSVYHSINTHSPDSQDIWLPQTNLHDPKWIGCYGWIRSKRNELYKDWFFGPALRAIQLLYDQVKIIGSIEIFFSDKRELSLIQS